MNREVNHQYVEILNKELVMALGCTEPIAIAYCSAAAVRALGNFPDKIIVSCSGNVIKNAKSVVVPHSNHDKGIEVAAILGAIGGNSDRELEVLSDINQEHIMKMKKLKGTNFCQVKAIEEEIILKIVVEAFLGDDSARVVIEDNHTNIVRIERNGVTVYLKDEINEINEKQEDRNEKLTIRKILEFANEVDLKEVTHVLDNQIKCNVSISEEGFHHNYGNNIGKLLLEEYGNHITVRAKAIAAAGSDARMGGCHMPVVINSGSGNQGLTVSLPVIEYAKELGASQEKLYRALVLSNLISIHVKSKIGKLSAYCGAVSAASGSGAGITYLHGGSYVDICNTIINTLGNTSGIVCDGAKSSCAAKIASSVDAAIMGHKMAMRGENFLDGDGIIKKDIEKTIEGIGWLAKRGMKETDIELLKIMLS